MPRISVKTPPLQRIVLGDCIDVFANERNIEAFVSDPPANIGFMGRSWDKSHPATDFVLPGKPRSNAHESDWRRKEAFIRYWSERYAMAYDVSDQHAVNLVWTLPRTSHQTAEALERAGWVIKDNIVHLFGTGWAKTGNALAPGQEGWLLAIKGKPDLDVDACRVPRGGAVPMPGGKIRSSRNFDGSESEYEMVDPPGDVRGSLPKNALLSHCEECERVGVKSVKGEKPRELHENGTMGYGGGKAFVGYTVGGNDDGTESVPAWHCLAGCICGARSKWDPDRPLPVCPCGETWQWWCAVAAVNEQSGDRALGGVVTSNHKGASVGIGFSDQGGASRFFNTFSYLAKCSSSERHAGCENLFWRANKQNPFGFDQVTKEEWERIEPEPTEGKRAAIGKDKMHKTAMRAQGNVHPTVKSYRLWHWLQSITGAKRIGDLTAGSGTGMYTSYLDGIDWLGAEICPQAITIAEARHAFWSSLTQEATAAFLDRKPMAAVLKIQGRTT